MINIIPWEAVAGDIRTLLYTALISSVSLVLHEMSHAAVASKLGLSVKTAHLAVFAFMSLACYVRLPGIYFLKLYASASASLLKCYSFFIIAHIFHFTTKNILIEYYFSKKNLPIHKF